MSNEQPKKAMSADEFFAQQGVGANNDVNAGVNNVGVNAKTENERTNNMQEMYKRANVHNQLIHQEEAVNIRFRM